MFTKRPGRLALTFLISATVVLAVAASSNAQHTQPRNHASLKRLIKKRAPAVNGFPLVPVGGAAAAPPSSSSTASSSSAAASTTSSPTSSATSQTRSATSSASSATLGLPDLSSLLNSESSTATESSTSTTSASTSSTTSEASTTATSEVVNVTGAPLATTPTVKPTVTFTASVSPSSTESSDASLQQTGASKGKSTTLTVLIVVASSIAAVTILWTVFRKWKLGRSSKFDERLNPIDFQPTTAADGTIPGAHRRLSGSSFHSGSGHGHSGPHGFGNDLPDHDFTAGPATLAPVGGYADLARGSSPQPQMHQANYGAPMNSRYDVGVPLHHQGYASQEAYYDPSGRRY